MNTKWMFKFISKDRLINYILTFGFEFLIMIISVLLFKLINIKYSPIGFSEYSINKRLVGFLMPLLMIGMGTSLPKFLAAETVKKQLEIHYTALIILSVFFITALGIGFSFSEQFSHLVFGDVAHEKMCLIVLLYVLSLMLHACVYNFFRGKFNYKAASFLQLINIGLLPLFTYFLADNLFDYFFYLSILTLVLLLVVNLIWIPFLRLKISDFRSSFKKLVSYGLQRMPGDVVLGLFFALPAFIAANYFSITIAGNIAFCISLFNIIIALMSPVNIILLPEASKMVSEKNFVLLKTVSKKLLILSLGVGVLTFLIVFLFGYEILNLFGVENLNQSVIFLRVIFLGVIGYSVFSVIRSIVDAFYETAKVSANVLIAFTVFLLIMFILKLTDSMSIKNTLFAFASSVNLLGVLTYLSLRKIDKIQHIH